MKNSIETNKINNEINSKLYGIHKNLEQQIKSLVESSSKQLASCPFR
ncbi:hypothetical protein HOK51_11070 [Candidatus Woesearchaeota archaeon]|jgi:hypothetical protein|nr:hypothetical protein [Candidatus Woesearchaeota archaeon]MBT6520363.1 hypothetical protein [Candidatus Woesearchaeota archaeon]MBT7368555.1 hypothetical protein [Candidatus Woesearchaeota archaeon]